MYHELLLSVIMKHQDIYEEFKKLDILDPDVKSKVIDLYNESIIRTNDEDREYQELCAIRDGRYE